MVALGVKLSALFVSIEPRVEVFTIDEIPTTIGAALDVIADHPDRMKRFWTPIGKAYIKGAQRSKKGWIVAGRKLKKLSSVKIEKETTGRQTNIESAKWFSGLPEWEKNRLRRRFR